MPMSAQSRPPFAQTMPAAHLPAGFGMDMADCITALGEEDFHARLLRMASQAIACDFWLVTRYERASAPLILQENGMAIAAKQDYSASYWRKDPLIEAHDMQADLAGTFSLSQRRQQGSIHRSYQHYLDTCAGVQDEIAFLLPMGPDCFLALCLDRSAGCFDAGELALAREIYPMLVALHNRHLRLAIDRQTDSEAALGGRMVIARSGHVLFRSDGWAEAMLTAFGRELPQAGLEQAGAIAGKDGWVLTSMPCLSADAALSDAVILTLTRTERSLSERLGRFTRIHGLTARQTEIIELALQGHHNASIAARLGISVGGVKNHKLRIYEKLDVTSERELTSCVLPHL